MDLRAGTSLSFSCSVICSDANGRRLCLHQILSLIAVAPSLVAFFLTVGDFKEERRSLEEIANRTRGARPEDADRQRSSDKMIEAKAESKAEESGLKERKTSASDDQLDVV